MHYSSKNFCSIMRNRDRRAYFKKLDSKDSEWTRGRACFTLPGRTIITPTNFSGVSYLNIEEYSYNYYYRNDCIANISKTVCEEYLQYKYLENRYFGKYKEFCDQELRHLNETKTFMIYEYDMYVLKNLEENWDPKILQKYMEYYNTCQFDFHRSSLVYTKFTGVLQKHCTDSVLIVNFFKMLCKHVISCENIFMGLISSLKFFLEHSRKIGYDPWTLLRKFQKQESSPVMSFCPVERALINGKLEHLKLLLKYGCPFSVSNYSAHKFNKKIDGRWWNRNRCIPILMPKDLSPFLTREDCNTGFRHSSTFLAHFTVILFLNMSNAVNSDGSQRENFIECAKLFMRSVPEAYITCDDMSAIIGNLAPSIGYTVTKSCDLYKTVFPQESTNGRKPRSLLHLSRIAIRQRRLLPEDISKLYLPERLKSFLNLEW